MVFAYSLANDAEEAYGVLKKKEVITRYQKRKQEKYLLDYLKNLHKIFEEEYCTSSCDLSPKSYVGNNRPTGRIQPAVRFDPARKTF
ncbi:hypothetical protein EVAR_2531_1 [Eumeta japonica]|uniref:Uncharacterized protein n=1 Tax=Eumeta variegata TaxID=151549 RepID=A0A4C1SNW1_EUMVA|nr:hypothetical protein EVAR_2531_1 [Eumeta japonica]